MTLANIPASQLMNHVAAGFCGASKLTPPPFRTMSKVPGGYGLPSTVGQSPKRAHCSHTPTMFASLKESELMLQVAPIPLGPTKAIAGPSANSMFPTGLPRGPQVPCHIPGLTLPAETFK